MGYFLIRRLRGILSADYADYTDYLSLNEKTKTQRERTGGLGNIRFRKTLDIIEAAEKGLLPDKL